MQKIEAIIYRVNNENTLEFIICKRPMDFGGYWQFVTGKVEKNESLKNTVMREIKEEIGVDDVVDVKDTKISFSFKNYQNIEAVEYVFLVKLSPNAKITLNHEFDQYCWLPYDKALEKLEYTNHKSNLEHIYKILQNLK